MGISLSPTFNPPSILTRSSVSSDLNHPQSQVDALVSRFVDEAFDAKTLLSFTAASFASRWAKLGVMSSGLRSGLVTPLSTGAALSLEVGVFEFSHRSLETFDFSPNGPSPGQRWSWSGPFGLKQGLINSFVNFGILKAGGFLSRNQNTVVRHLFQSSAMVAGHNTAATLGISPEPEGTLPEQLLRAEITNLQWEAGMGLVSSFAPGWLRFEKALDRSLFQKTASTIGPLPWLSFALETGRQVLPSVFSSKNHLSPNILMSSAGEGGGKKPRSRNPQLDLSLPVLSARRNEDLIHQAEHLEKLSQTWLNRLNPATSPLLKEKLGGDLSFQELMEKLPEFLHEHQKLIESWIHEIGKKENQSHPDHNLNLSFLKAIAYRIEGMLGASGEFRGSAPHPEELKDFLTTLYRGANVLIGLGQANNYDPIFIVEALDHYHEALLDWLGYLHPDQSYELLQTFSENPSSSMPAERKTTQDLETRRLLKQVFGPNITPEHFSEAYPDLDRLSFEISRGTFLLIGERWNLEEDIPVGRVEREFIFLGGAWNISRNYEPILPPSDLALREPSSFRPPAWEPEETKTRLEKEFALYDRLGVERIVPADLEKPLWNIPFASMDWFKKRLFGYLNVHRQEISFKTISELKELYQIAHLKEEKTKTPVGARFLHDLNLSWEGILSLPPSWKARARFEDYYAGRKATAEKIETEGRLRSLKNSLKEPSPSLKEILEKFALLVQQFSQQTTLRYRIDLGWGGFHHLREHLAHLETLRRRSRNKREKEILKKEIEKGIGLVEKALRSLSPLSGAPYAP